jgi:hypothetical protein
MGQISNLLKESENSFHTQRNETKQYVTKWEKTGLLEGIDKDYEKHNTAILLENQAKQLISEASKIGGQNSEEWNGVALPLVRRIFAEISAKDFVSVQPMNLPSGLVFWLDFKYGTNAPAELAESYKYAQGKDVMGDTSSSSTPSGGFYGRGKSTYSVNMTSSLLQASNYAMAATGSGANANAIWRKLGYDGALSSSISSAVSGAQHSFVQVLELDAGSHIADADTYAATEFIVSQSAATGARTGNANGDNIIANLNQYNYFSEADNKYYLFFSMSLEENSDIDANNDLAVIYPKRTETNYSRGDWEDTTPAEMDGSGDDIGIPEINVELRQEALVAKTRKLKVIWTPEFAQDLNAYHSIDAEAELTSMLSEYISMEIDLEILNMCLDSALHTGYWSATIGETHNDGSDTWTAGSSAVAYQQGTWFQTLGTQMQKISNKIHASTMRGGANFVVVGPDVATIIESIPGYAADTDGTKGEFAMGVQKVGSLNNRWTVYKNPYIQDNIVLMGFRGTQFLETGAVYAPYIPLIMTPLVYDPTNFTPRKGVMTRYAKKVVRPEFYGKLFIKDLNKI